VIPALGRLRQEEHRFKASLDYTVRFCLKKILSNLSRAPVPHTCNPSYSGGRDQEDQGLKPAQANSSQDSISKKDPSQKKGWWSGSRCRP
jgi:hypothetical protein